MWCQQKKCGNNFELINFGINSGDDEEKMKEKFQMEEKKLKTVENELGVQVPSSSNNHLKNDNKSNLHSDCSAKDIEVLKMDRLDIKKEFGKKKELSKEEKLKKFSANNSIYLKETKSQMESNEINNIPPKEICLQVSSANKKYLELKKQQNKFEIVISNDSNEMNHNCDLKTLNKQNSTNDLKNQNINFNIYTESNNSNKNKAETNQENEKKIEGNSRKNTIIDTLKNYNYNYKRIIADLDEILKYISNSPLKDSTEIYDLIKLEQYKNGSNSSKEITLASRKRDCYKSIVSEEISEVKFKVLDDSNDDTSIKYNIKEIDNVWHSIFYPLTSEEKNKRTKPRFEAIRKIDKKPKIKKKQTIPALEMSFDNIHKSSHTPFVCPATKCKQHLCISELGRHIKMDHSKVPIFCADPGDYINVFLNSKVDMINIIKCRCLLLISNKIENFGGDEFQNYLPVLLMSTKVNILDLYSIDSTKLLQDKEVCNIENINQEYLLIWLTGLIHADVPVYYCLTAWPRYSKQPECHLTKFGEIFSIQENQDVKKIRNNGYGMVLSQKECNLLTDNGKNMIEFQIMIS